MRDTPRSASSPVGEMTESEEIRELRDELLKARQSTDEAVKEFDLLCYSISHDLRTPLRAIDGFSAILEEDYMDRLDDQGKHYLRVVREGARKIERRIEAVLAVSRMGRHQMNSVGIDMNSLASSVLDELKGAAAGRAISSRIERLPPAFGDRDMVRQVLVELLDNAIKFTRPRGTASIVLKGERAEEENIYSVNDNGVGFDMEYAGNLFGLFQKLHSSDTFEGEGAGLAKVRRIIDRHGGRVWAEGKVDIGATFYFTL